MLHFLQRIRFARNTIGLTFADRGGQSRNFIHRQKLFAHVLGILRKAVRQILGITGKVLLLPVVAQLYIELTMARIRFAVIGLAAKFRCRFSISSAETSTAFLLPNAGYACFASSCLYDKAVAGFPFALICSANLLATSSNVGALRYSDLSFAGSEPFTTSASNSFARSRA